LKITIVLTGVPDEEYEDIISDIKAVLECVARELDSMKVVIIHGSD
jgi:hypothetical protein